MWISVALEAVAADVEAISDALMQAGAICVSVEDARAEGRRILPLCTFAAAQFRRNPDWQDVLAR